MYGYDDEGEFVVRVQKTKECPPVLNILGIILGVIGAVVAIGFALLLLWKLFTVIHDRREFARFEKERQLAKWDTVRIMLLMNTLASLIKCFFVCFFREKILSINKRHLLSKIRHMVANSRNAFFFLNQSFTYTDCLIMTIFRVVNFYYHGQKS